MNSCISYMKASASYCRHCELKMMVQYRYGTVSIWYSVNMVQCRYGTVPIWYSVDMVQCRYNEAIVVTD